ncbi:MAG: LysE family translocator [Hyphomicrobiaceae bacterium]|nr:LysE family translocator [Hyphomicrobiaceae bacterium]
MQLIPNPLIIPIGLVIGVLVSAPVGPVNVLCIQRAIERGFWGGVAAGLGAVLGDGLIALLAALGVGAISGAIQDYRNAIQVIGGIALIGFGVKLYLTLPRVIAGTGPDKLEHSLAEFLWDTPKTFFLTITNPGAVLGLFAIFGGVSSFVEVRSTVDALTMVAAIIAGSITWWVLLSSLIGRIRHRFAMARLRQINRVAGILLLGFGAVLVGELVLEAVLLASSSTASLRLRY